MYFIPPDIIVWSLYLYLLS